MFWLNDISILYKNPLDFFPTGDQDRDSRLNSMVRLGFYTSVALFLYDGNSNYKYFYILGALMILTIIVYRNTESLDNTTTINPLAGTATVTVPTLDNPFMNFTMGDMLNTDENGTVKYKPPIADPLNPEVQKEMSINYNANEFRDANDLFNRNTGEWAFFTLPEANAVKDRDEFQKWLYAAPETCHEGNNCLRYEDLRSKRPLFPDKYSDPNRIKK